MGAEEKTLALILQLKDEFSVTMQRVEGNQRAFIKQQKEHWSDFEKSLGSVGKTLIGLFSVDRVVAWGASVMDAGSQIERMSEKFKLSTDRVQELRYAADQTDTSFESLSGAYSKLARAAASADDGNKKAVAAFEDLGVKWTDGAGNLRNLDDLMTDVAGALGKMSNETERNAAAMDLLGKGGTEVIPMIREIAAASEEARDKGAVWSKESIENIGALEKAIKDARSNLNGAAVELTSPLWRDAADVVDSVAAAIKAVGTNAAESSTLLQGMGTALGVVRDSAGWLGEQFADESVKAGKRTLLNSKHQGVDPLAGRPVEDTSWAEDLLNMPVTGFGGMNDSEMSDAFSGFSPGSGPKAVATKKPPKSPRLKATVPGVFDFDKSDKVTTPDDQDWQAVLKRESEERQRLVEELQSQSYDGQIALTEQYYKKDQKLLGDNAAAQTALTKKHDKDLRNIRAAEADARLGQEASVMGALSSLSGTFFGKQSAAAKIFAAGEIIMNTQRGVMQAHAAYPPPMGGLMALIPYAAGAAALAGLAGGGGGGSSGGGSVSAPSVQTTSPEPPTATGGPVETITSRERTGPSIQNNFTIHVGGSVVRENELIDEQIIPRIQQRIRDNVDMGLAA
ncbi:MAG: hypothetical protein WCS84_11710 [Nocardioides sp.]|jgi:hypothetical protein